MLEAKVVASASFVWRSICWGLDLIKKGVCLWIGNGASTHVFLDPWLLCLASFKPITIVNEPSNSWKVSDFILNGNWTLLFLEQVFHPLDVEVIKNIALSHQGGEDTFVWHYEASSMYSMKLGYCLAMTVEVSCNQSGIEADAKWWKCLRQLKLPCKIKIYLWRAFLDVLPTRTNLLKCHIRCSTTCPWCHEENESVLHAFCGCRVIEKVWWCMSFWIDL